MEQVEVGGVILNTDEGGDQTLWWACWLSDAEPTELLFLFLTDDFWTLRTDETNRYENQFLATQTLKPGSGSEDILLIFCCFYVDKMTEKQEKGHNFEQLCS